MLRPCCFPSQINPDFRSPEVSDFSPLVLFGTIDGTPLTPLSSFLPLYFPDTYEHTPEVRCFFPIVRRMKPRVLFESRLEDGSLRRESRLGVFPPPRLLDFLLP